MCKKFFLFQVVGTGQGGPSFWCQLQRRPGRHHGAQPQRSPSCCPTCAASPGEDLGHPDHSVLYWILSVQITRQGQVARSWVCPSCGVLREASGTQRDHTQETSWGQVPFRKLSVVLEVDVGHQWFSNLSEHSSHLWGGAAPPHRRVPDSADLGWRTWDFASLTSLAWGDHTWRAPIILGRVRSLQLETQDRQEVALCFPLSPSSSQDSLGLLSLRTAAIGPQPSLQLGCWRRNGTLRHLLSAIAAPAGP